MDSYNNEALFMGESLFEYIMRCTAESRDHTALKKGISGPALRYDELSSQVERISKYFKPGHVISLALTNTIESVVCFLAIGLAGAVVTPLNPDNLEQEFEYYLKKSTAGVIIPKSQADNSPVVKAAKKLGTPILRVDIDNKGVVSLENMTQGVITRPKILGPETHLILYTSGTTGEPKAVPLSHSNLIASTQNIAETYELNPTDTTIAIMPLFHIHGLMASLFATLISGGTVVLPASGKFSASSFFKELVNTHCTWFSAVPTMHHILLNTKNGRDYLARHKLRFIRSSSSALAPGILFQIEKMYGVQVLEAYAMTEASHQMTSNPLNGRKPGTVGIPHGSVQVRIFHPSEDTVLPAGTRGEVCVMGQNVTSGYINNAEANKRSFTRDGFFRTGDEGFHDRDDFLTITGRLKELINKGGEKISPIEIDSVLLSHPDVSEAVAFAIPDSKYGEVVGVAIVLKTGSSTDASTIKTFVGSKLAGFKVPSHVFVVQNIPRTATGKIQRRLVAEKLVNKSRL